MWATGSVPGIIPAYAGSTGFSLSMSVAAADHPRIRGEHPIAAKPDNLVMGSSPHTRGARDDGPLHGGAVEDHPRIRGEHCVRESVPRADQGSSPHTRGARVDDGTKTGALGIIPAYAGSTL